MIKKSESNTTAISREFSKECYLEIAGYPCLGKLIHSLLTLECPDDTHRINEDGNIPGAPKFGTYQALRAHLLTHRRPLALLRETLRSEFGDYLRRVLSNNSVKYERDYVVSLLDQLFMYYKYHKRGNSQRRFDVKCRIIKALDVPLIMFQNMLERHDSPWYVPNDANTLEESVYLGQTNAREKKLP